MEDNKFEQVVLEALQSRITKILPGQILSCIEELSEEQLWWRPNEESNSVGNLVLHLSGSMRHYIAKTVGNLEYERNRQAEFSERKALPKEEVVDFLTETIAQVLQVFQSFDQERFLETTPETAYNPTIFNLLFNVAIHLATHTGQIVFITKMLKEGAVDELWIHAHKSL
jgi:uncharacterized damage-inducible protein DinB